MSKHNPSKKLSQKCDIAIHYDSQAAVKALSSYVIDSKLFWECRSKLYEADKKNKVSLILDPGYSRIKRNEESNIQNECSNALVKSPRNEILRKITQALWNY